MSVISTLPKTWENIEKMMCRFPTCQYDIAVYQTINNYIFRHVSCILRVRYLIVASVRKLIKRQSSTRRQSLLSKKLYFFFSENHVKPIRINYFAPLENVRKRNVVYTIF